MKITKRQLRRIIREAAGEMHLTGKGWKDPVRHNELESLINGWIPQPVIVELVRGTTYIIRGIEPAMVPEVIEEVEDFGGTIQGEISSSVSPGLKDLNINLGR